MNQVVINLQDSVIVLEKMNRQAFEDGFNSSINMYESLSEKYIDELSKGKVSWGWSAAGVVAAGVAGIFIGRGTK